MQLHRIFTVFCLEYFTSGCATIMSNNETVSNFETQTTNLTCLLTGDNNFKITFKTPAQRLPKVEHTHYKLNGNAAG
jgi:uncharacterized protein YceK